MRVRKTWGRRQWLLLGLTILMLVGLGAWLPVAFPDFFLKGRLETLLEERLGLPVRVGSVSAGWLSEVVAHDVVVSELAQDGSPKSEVCLRIPSLLFNRGLAGWLSEEDAPVRVLLQDPEMFIRRDGDGRLAARWMLEAVAETWRDEETLLPAALMEVEVAGGKLHLEPAGGTYRWDGVVSCDNPAESEPWRGLWELASGESGTGELVTVLGAWRREQGPELEIGLTVKELPFGALSRFLEPWLGFTCEGRARRVSVNVETTEQGTSVEVDADLRDLLTRRSEEGAEPLPVLEHTIIRGRGRLVPGGIADAEGLVQTPQGFLTVSPGARLVERDGELDVDVAAAVEVHDLAVIDRLLGGRLPDGVELIGRGRVNGRVSGKIRLDREEGEEVHGLSGSASISLDRMTWPGSSAYEMAGGLRLAESRLHVDTLTFGIDGGSVTAKGSFSLPDPEASSNVVWEATTPVTWTASAGEGQDALVSFTGSGDIRADAGAVVTSVDVKLHEAVLPVPGRSPLRLPGVQLLARARSEDGRRLWALSDVLLTSPEMLLRVEEGSLLLSADAAPRVAVRGAARLSRGLVSRLGIRFGEIENPARLRGRLDTPLWGASWTQVKGRGEAELGTVVWEGRRFEELQVRVEKSPDVLEVRSLTAKHGAGTVSVSGRWPGGPLRPGDGLSARFLDFPVDAVLPGRQDGERLRFRGVGSGTVALTGERDGWSLDADLRWATADLVRQEDVVSDQASATLKGVVRRSGGAIVVEQLQVVGPDLQIDAAGSRWPSPSAGDRRVAVRGRGRAPGPWVAALLGPTFPPDGVLEGPVSLDADLSWDLSAPGTLEGRVGFELGAAELLGRRVRGLRLDASASGGRLEVKTGRVMLEGGALDVAGTLPLAEGAGRDGDAFTVALDRFPFRFRETVGEQGTRLKTFGLCTGRVTLEPAGDSLVKAGGKLSFSGLARELVTGSTVPLSQRLPDLSLDVNGVLDLRARRIEIASALVRGGDVTGELRALEIGPEIISLGGVFLRGGPGTGLALLLGRGERFLRPAGGFTLDIEGTARRGEPVASFSGKVRATCERGRLLDLELADLEVRLEARDGEFAVRRAGASVADGSLTLTEGSRFRLGGAARPFECGVRIQDLRLKGARLRLLGLVHPLLVAEPGRGGLDGTLTGELRLESPGTRPGLTSDDVTGDGRVVLREATMVSSLALSRLAAGLEAVLGQQLSSRQREQVGNPRLHFGGLAARGFSFPRVESSFEIRKGRIRPTGPVSLVTPDVAFELSGWAGLAGEMVYTLRTDWIERRRALLEGLGREVTIPAGTEVRFHVGGYLFRVAGDGAPAIQVRPELTR